MTAAAAGIFNHQLATAAQTFAGKSATPMDSSTSGTSGTGGSSDDSSSATISANDFLTLLVTEMQNQDPTSNTDPNEYINQLVQVNSLEQLIDINQTLSAGSGSAPANSNSGATGKVAPASPNSTVANPAAATGTVHAAVHRTSVLSALQTVSASPAAAAQASAKQRAPGNLGVPGVNRSAQRVGRALDGQTHAAGLK